MRSCADTNQTGHQDNFRKIRHAKEIIAIQLYDKC